MLKTLLNSCTKNYLRFDGRCSRKEYVFFTIFLLAVFITTHYLYQAREDYDNLSFVFAIFSLFLFVNDFAITARRFHDLNSSGWWQLILFFVPLAQILFIGLFFFKGTPGPNKYGEPPVD
jgi:uncharacterized membrane protein YhaH (DUF805 family)